MSARHSEMRVAAFVSVEDGEKRRTVGRRLHSGNSGKRIHMM